MSEATITKKVEDLRKLFNQMKRVLYTSAPKSALTSLSTFDMELPVLSDGVTFNLGEASVTKVKLTTGDTWTAISAPGDSDIQFQVASVAGEVNELLMNKVGAAVNMTASIGSVTYTGQGYSNDPKKVEGGLLLVSEDKQSALFLPNIEGYANLVSEANKPAYFNLKVTPLNDATGCAIYILAPKAGA